MKYKILFSIFIILFIGYLIHEHIRRWFLRYMAVTTINIFNQNDVDYYIDYGTLLGLYREKDIILDDNDVDICVFDTQEFHDKIPIIRNQLQNKFLTIEKLEWSAYRVYLKHKFLDLFCDIYLVKKDGDMVRDAVTSKSDIPLSLVGNKSTIHWKNLDVKCPEKINELLIFRYGDDYMTPKRGYKGNI